MEDQNKNTPEPSDQTSQDLTSEETLQNPSDDVLFEEEAELLPIPLEIIEAEIAREEVDELYLCNQEANTVILSFSAAAAATGAIPIPLADAPLLVGEQIAMMAKLSDIYHINLKRSGLKSLLFAALGVSGTTILGKSITSSLFKMLPGLGSITGAAINGTTAAALTAALGAAYNELCQKVFLGELDEKLLLSHEGRALLEISFQNHLKKEKKDDALSITPIPNQDTPIVLPTELTPEECGKSLSADQEKVHNNLDDLAHLIQKAIDQDQLEEIASPTTSQEPEKNQDENKMAQSEQDIAPAPQEKEALNTPSNSTKTTKETETSDLSEESSTSYSPEDIDRLVALYTTPSDSVDEEIQGFSFPSSKIQN